ncbi:hypothetical protein [Glaciihabitans sp. dw_435]|uniref:hypothetical protein n=1 Tax=Glaciihabitans sp. dw_435 TaxID=2720081 RepID=UPI001BD4AA25|nr:hypothetical protein [Glaciihabitans sp. dw_435]
MRFTPTLAVSALVLTVATALAGCSSASPEPASSSAESVAPSPSTTAAASSTLDATPAAGDVITGTGYSYAVPKGWGKHDSAAAAGTDSIAIDLAPTGNFANNVNVVLSPAGAVTPAQVEAAAGSELTSSGATGVAVLDRVTVAGSESAHITATMTSSGVTYRIHQYYLSTDKQTYIVTFSYGTSVPDADAIGIAESVLASWKWS